MKGVFSGPKSLLQKNYNEFFDFTDFKPYEIQVVDGSPRERAKQMANPDAKVLLMGYKRFTDDWRTLKEHHPEINAHAVDEWHLGFKTSNHRPDIQLGHCMEEPR